MKYTNVSYSIRPELQEVWNRAQAGDLEAMVIIADSLAATTRSFTPVGDIPDEASNLYAEAIEGGLTSAYVHWALELHRRGQIDDAVELLREGAETGDAEILWNLGGLLWSESVRMLDEASVWLKKAVEGGHVKAMVNLGLVLRSQGDLDSAVNLWLAAADLGNADACVNLGIHNISIDGRPETGAEYWFERARSLGHPGLGDH